jgi:hypothetical protein
MSGSTRTLVAAGLVVATGALLSATASVGGAVPAVASAASRSTCTTYFVASVLHGPDRGTDYRGVLTMKVDASGRPRQGSFVSFAGPRVRVSARTRHHTISLAIPLRHGTLAGTGRVDGSLRYCAGRMLGRLKGPGRHDRGSWLATTGQSINIGGDVILSTASETPNHPNPQVVYRINGLSGPLTVFAGGLNAAGNVDGQRLAARMNRPSGLGYDSARSVVYVADVSNSSIRRLDMSSNQETTTLRQSDVVAAAHAAGYSAVSGWEPHGVVVVGGGALLISDVRNYVIWRYNPMTLQVKLYAGNPGVAGNADGSDTAVRFRAPDQVMVSSDGLRADNPARPPARSGDRALEHDRRRLICSAGVAT